MLAYFLEEAAYVIDATFLVRIFKSDPALAAYAEWTWVLSLIHI